MNRIIVFLLLISMPVLAQKQKTFLVNTNVDGWVVHQDIKNGLSITNELEGVNVDGNNVTVCFATPVSASDWIVVSNKLAVYDGTPEPALPPNFSTIVAIEQRMYASYQSLTNDVPISPDKPWELDDSISIYLFVPGYIETNVFTALQERRINRRNEELYDGFGILKSVYDAYGIPERMYSGNWSTTNYP